MVEKDKQTKTKQNKTKQNKKDNGMIIFGKYQQQQQQQVYLR
jgi:hypothetical protein